MTEVQDTLEAPQLRRKAPERAARSVLPACAGAWTAAEIMHATGIPWLDIGLGAAAVAGVAYGKGARPGTGWLLAAGAWTALAVKLGPLAVPGLYWPVTQAWAVLSFCGWRWTRSHPAVVAARDRRLASSGWLSRAHRYGLKGSHLLDHEQTRLGERMVVDVKGTGRRASQLAHGDTAERIAEDEGLPPSRVQVKPHRLAGRMEISIRREDPWAKPVTHPVLADDPEIDLSGPYSIRSAAVVGQDPETGRPLPLPLWDERGGKNVTIVSIKGGGKTVLLNDASERVTAARDALMVRVNLSIKGLAEARRWGPACHLTAFGRQQQSRAVRVLRVVGKIIEWRSQQVYDTDVFVPSADDPLIVVIMDEADSAAEIPAIRHEMEDIARRGREYGVTLVRASQRGTAEAAGGGNIRAQDDVFCIGMINRRGEAMHAAGDLGLSMPDMASYGEGHGGVWVVAELGGSQHVGRTFMLKDPGDIARIVAERARQQPDLKPELKAFLGDSYEHLLSTDVYAQWARDQQESPVVAHPRPDIPEPAPDGTAPQAAPVATATATIDHLDWPAEEALDDPLRVRLAELDRKNAETRRTIAETAAMPQPDISHDDQVAHANARWRQIGEGTEIPGDAREKLLALLAAGKLSASKAAGELGVTPWTARTYLERLRLDGLAHAAGKGRSAGWFAGPEPIAEGDAP